MRFFLPSNDIQRQDAVILSSFVGTPIIKTNIVKKCITISKNFNKQFQFRVDDFCIRMCTVLHYFVDCIPRLTNYVVRYCKYILYNARMGTYHLLKREVLQFDEMSESIIVDDITFKFILSMPFSLSSNQTVPIKMGVEENFGFCDVIMTCALTKITIFLTKSNFLYNIILETDFRQFDEGLSLYDVTKAKHLKFWYFIWYQCL